MALKSIVIEADAADETKAEDDINTALDSSGITGSQFIQAITIGYQINNQTATIVIFYDDGT